MTSNFTVAVIVLIALSSTPISEPDDDRAGEITTLQKKLTKLECENAKLREELKLARHRQLQADMQLLVYLEGHLDGALANVGKSKQAMRLAVRLAPTQQNNGFIWRILFKTKVLKDGMSLSDVKKLIGPPTTSADSHVDWYFNPSSRHVAPYLRAAVTKDGLADWQYGKR